MKNRHRSIGEAYKQIDGDRERVWGVRVGVKGEREKSLHNFYYEQIFIITIVNLIY